MKIGEIYYFLAILRVIILLKKYFVSNLKKCILSTLLWGIFFIFTFSITHAFLWEDLWLDLYKKVDEGFYSLKEKQYEYELTDQGRTTVNNAIKPILADRGIECDINSSQEIENLLWNNGGDVVANILDACGYENAAAPTRLTEEVQNALAYTKNSYSQRAQKKTDATYDIARIGLYNDGDLENSPFDIIHDLKEIDKIIFTQEIDYEGVPYDTSSDSELDKHLEEWRSNDTHDEDNSDDESIDDEESKGWEEDKVVEDLLMSPITNHNFVCIPKDNSGIDSDDLEDIIDDIENPGWYTPVVNIWEYPDVDDFQWNGPLWWYYEIPPLSGTYNTITDSWGCDPWDFFCIIISFENSNYGLTGWETLSIEKILAKAAWHLEKPANASLTQHKMQTNNFEIWANIKNLPDMLRGFWLEVQTKPIPILETERTEEANDILWEVSETEKRLMSYYKNLWLDYKRRNDLGSFRWISGKSHSELERKIVETSAGMPINYSEERKNELKRFQTALAENNRILSESTGKEIAYNDMKKIAEQFTEIERFVHAIEDFTVWFWDHVKRLSEIPKKVKN